jgi:hypothetical protein
MSPQRPDNLDQRLDALFQNYRDSVVVPEASANFMPDLWRRVEGRRSIQLDLRRWAQGFVTLAAAASLAIAILQAWPSLPIPANTYVEVLSAEHSPDQMPFQDVAFLERSAQDSIRPAGVERPPLR